MTFSGLLLIDCQIKNMLTQNFKTTSFFLLFGFLFLIACQSETATIQTAEGELEVSSEEFLQTLGEAYIYGYPLILMDFTQKVSTNIEKPHPTRPSAPVNQLGHFRTFPDHTLTAVVKPNVDAYYSIAWLALAAEPQVLFMPATDRYYLLPLLDAYSNVFASPGTRTTGTSAQIFLIAGPDWKGEIPEGMQYIQSPTQMAWMLGRIQVNSPEDGATVVRGIQDSMRLVPLSAYGNPKYIPPTGKVEAEYENVIPVKAVRDLETSAYFNRLLELMVDNPSPEADSLILRKMAKIGLVPGQTAQLGTDNFILNKKLQAMPGFIHKKMEKRRANPDTSLLVNGWTLVTEGIGTYGTDYLRRAFIDFIGLGANLPEDAIYPNLTYDVNGNRLDARNDYQIHFEKEQLPPVHAFWSLTAYNADEFLIENDLNRHALGDRDQLLYNADGSLDLYIQSKAPIGDKRRNWLPIPEKGAFFLTLRLYWPKAEALNGDWKPAVVIPVGKER